MNYWHMQLHPNDNESFSREDVFKILTEKNLIGLGREWPQDKGQPKLFSEKIQLGDIILIRSHGPLALVKVVGICEDNTDSDLWFELIRKVEILSTESELFKSKYENEKKELWSKGLFCPLTIASANNSEFIDFWYKNIIEKIRMKENIQLLKYKKQIILQGLPGTGKTWQAKSIANELIYNDITNSKIVGESKLIQFHPSYSYEDFVRGIVADTYNGNILYKVENKILAEFSKKAQTNPNKNYVLILDEINRANLASVLGELIYALEYRDEPVCAMYKIDNEQEIILPSNLYIIGTMNTADRSVGHIDYAIRRRFAFVDIFPDETIIEEPSAKKLFNQVKMLFSEKYLSNDFKPTEVMLGHSYFLVESLDELKIKLKFEIKPILREYLKDGILLETASIEIENLNV